MPATSLIPNVRPALLARNSLRISQYSYGPYSSRYLHSTAARRAAPAHGPPRSPGEEAILAAAYGHVPEHGFSHRAIVVGAHDAGYPDASAAIVADAVFGLIRYHLAKQRTGLAERSLQLFKPGGHDAAAKTVAERVELLTWERLVANRDVIHKWQEALAIMAQPSYLQASISELAKLSDEIWHLAGDRCTDSSWYSKRASLSLIYSTTELYMTTDSSANFHETGQFLRRRFREASSTAALVRDLGQWASFTAHAGLNVLRSKAIRI